ncbi:hypothetical protein NHQ30_010140 [Ciborinia camelliae]|nr:hypothetical protein NHQ30_010140 [Ciborinia camelliae]
MRLKFAYLKFQLLFVVHFLTSTPKPTSYQHSTLHQVEKMIPVQYQRRARHQSPNRQRRPEVILDVEDLYDSQVVISTDGAPRASFYAEDEPRGRALAYPYGYTASPTTSFNAETRICEETDQHTGQKFVFIDILSDDMSLQNPLSETVEFHSPLNPRFHYQAGRNSVRIRPLGKLDFSCLGYDATRPRSQSLPRHTLSPEPPVLIRRLTDREISSSYELIGYTRSGLQVWCPRCSLLENDKNPRIIHRPTASMEREWAAASRT